jgi:hypothetical protein
MKLTKYQMASMLKQRILGKINTASAKGDSITEAEWTAWLIRMENKAMKERLNEEFIEDFLLWLNGKSPYNSTEFDRVIFGPDGRITDRERVSGTPWGSKPLTIVPGVVEFLDQGIDRRSETITYLTKLKARGPTTLDECYLYYKYLIREVALDAKGCNEVANLAPYDYPLGPDGNTHGPASGIPPPDRFDEDRYHQDFEDNYNLCKEDPEAYMSWITSGAPPRDVPGGDRYMTFINLGAYDRDLLIANAMANTTGRRAAASVFGSAASGRPVVPPHGAADPDKEQNAFGAKQAKSIVNELKTQGTETRKTIKAELKLARQQFAEMVKGMNTMSASQVATIGALGNLTSTVTNIDAALTGMYDDETESMTDGLFDMISRIDSTLGALVKEKKTGGDGKPKSPPVIVEDGPPSPPGASGDPLKDAAELIANQKAVTEALTAKIDEFVESQNKNRKAENTKNRRLIVDIMAETAKIPEDYLGPITEQMKEILEKMTTQQVAISELMITKFPNAVQEMIKKTPVKVVTLDMKEALEGIGLEKDFITNLFNAKNEEITEAIGKVSTALETTETTNKLLETALSGFKKTIDEVKTDALKFLPANLQHLLQNMPHDLVQKILTALETPHIFVQPNPRTDEEYVQLREELAALKERMRALQQHTLEIQGQIPNEMELQLGIQAISASTAQAAIQNYEQGRLVPALSQFGQGLLATSGQQAIDIGTQAANAIGQGLAQVLLNFGNAVKNFADDTRNSLFEGMQQARVAHHPR